MTSTFTIHATLAILVALFLVTFVVLSRYFREFRELKWFAAALTVAIPEVFSRFLLTTTGPAALVVWIFAFSSPVIYLLAAKAFMVHFRSPLQMPRTTIPALALITIAMICQVSGADYVWRFSVQQVSTALPILEIALITWSAAGSRWRTRLITVCGVAAALQYVARVPAALIIIGPGFTRSELSSSGIPTVSMMVVVLVFAAATILFLSSIIAKIVDGYRNDAEHDPLTGLLNRRGFSAHCEQTCRDSVVIMADIDHFKMINDRYGHETGDKAICAFADIIRQLDAIACRMGGEEFAIIVPHAELRTGLLIAEGIRSSLSAMTFETGTTEFSMTASFGVAAALEGESFEDILASADKALYKAKNSGRNCVVVNTRSPVAKPETAALAANFA